MKADARALPPRAVILLGVDEPGQRLINCTYLANTSALLTRSEPGVLGMGLKNTTWDYDGPADQNDNPAVYNQKPGILPRRIIEEGATRNLSGTGIRHTAVTTLTHNAKGQVTNVDGPTDGTDDNTAYAYSTDTFSNAFSITRPVEGTTSFSRYDGAGFPAWTQDANNRQRALAYDGGGNREERTVTRSWGSEVATYAYTPGTNQLASETTGAAETDYTHDSRGNVTGIGGRTLAHDQEGRLIRVSSGATTLGSYGYDGLDVNGNSLPNLIGPTIGSGSRSTSDCDDQLNPQWMTPEFEFCLSIELCA